MAEKRPIPFLSFRFYLDAGPGTAEEFAISFARDTAHGLELGRPHVLESPTLYAELIERNLREVTIVMMGREQGVRREVTYALGGPMRHLAVDLDSMRHDMALDRVLFPDATLIRIRDFGAESQEGESVEG